MRHVIESGEYWIEIYWMRGKSIVDHREYAPGEITQHAAKDILLYGTIDEIRLTPDYYHATVEIYL